MLDCSTTIVDQFEDSVGLPAINYAVLRTMRSFLVKYLTRRICSTFSGVELPFSSRTDSSAFVFFEK